MNTFNKIIMGFLLVISMSPVKAQTNGSLFSNTHPSKRIYNENEIILPNYLQFEMTGPSGNTLESTIADNLVQIRWQTKKETNTSHFELQRSIDGQHFEPIETITANGISLKNSSYATTDTFNTGSYNAVYYRVKSVFVNGKEAFTSILAVEPASEDQVSINR